MSGLSGQDTSLGVGRRIAMRMTAFAETPIMAAIRAGVVAVVPPDDRGGSVHAARESTASGCRSLGRALR